MLPCPEKSAVAITPERHDRAAAGPLMPTEVDVVEWEDWRFEVVDVDGRRTLDKGAGDQTRALVTVASLSRQNKPGFRNRGPKRHATHLRKRCVLTNGLALLQEQLHRRCGTLGPEASLASSSSGGSPCRRAASQLRHKAWTAISRVSPARQRPQGR